MHVIIDLVGEGVIIQVPVEESPEEIKKRELQRQYVINEIIRRSPQPQLEIVPIERKASGH